MLRQLRQLQQLRYDCLERRRCGVAKLYGGTGTGSPIFPSFLPWTGEAVHLLAPVRQNSRRFDAILRLLRLQLFLMLDLASASAVDAMRIPRRMKNLMISSHSSIMQFSK